MIKKPQKIDLLSEGLNLGFWRSILDPDLPRTPLLEFRCSFSDFRDIVALIYIIYGTPSENTRKSLEPLKCAVCALSRPDADV